jgi:hypothetical protein
MMMSDVDGVIRTYSSININARKIDPVLANVDHVPAWHVRPGHPSRPDTRRGQAIGGDILALTLHRSRLPAHQLRHRPSRHTCGASPSKGRRQADECEPVILLVVSGTAYSPLPALSPQTPAVARSQRRDMRRVLAMVVAEMPGTASTAFSKSMSAEPLSANAILDPHNDAADVTPSEPPWPTQCPP